ncbi:MAG TPA: DUF1990 domain-containing protein [Nitrososphaera sp.]|nr:DUF1990 domain-containing protein [Nitrososphaera sp.]
MFTLSKPSGQLLEKIIQQESQSAPAYQEIALTRDGRTPSSGYRTHEIAVKLAEGEASFEVACDAMRAWKHFPSCGILLYPSTPVIEEGTNLIVCARHIFLWSINACRIIYIIDESTSDKRRFGYGYGTLPIHSERGEERFLLEWERQSNAVTYQILAFSAANHMLVSIFWPLAKVIQDRFRFASVNALSSIVHEKTTSTVA